MKNLLKSTPFKLVAIVVVLLIFSACLAVTGGRGDENTPNNPANDVVEPAPPVEQQEDPAPPPPEPDPEPTSTPEPPPPSEPVEEPAPSIPDEPLNTSRLLNSIEDVMLHPEDLVEEYVMQNNKEVTNDRVIQQTLWTDGRQYNSITGRITGWNTYMERVGNTYAPYSFRTRLEVFETIQGAQTAFSSDWLFIFNDTNLNISEFLSTDCQYGHQCVLAYYEENIPGTTDYNLEYHLVFRYRNVSVYVFSKGLEGTVNENTVYEIAELVISRLELFE
jgi:hypothetical protein